MFDHLMRELRKLEQGVSLPVSIPLDEQGYLDRQCPAVECRSQFKVLFNDWREKVQDEVVYCAVCRHEAPATEWNTSTQAAYMVSVTEAYVQRTVGRALRQDATHFNRQAKPGFVSIALDVRPGAPIAIVPLEAADAMRQTWTCERCGCHYAAIGAAFFCPACGYNSAIASFDYMLTHVRDLITNLPASRTALLTAYDADLASDTIRLMLENSLVRLVGSFQCYSEALFMQVPSSSGYKRRKNIFQNLTEVSSLWRTAVGSGYEALLLSQEYADLNRLFQQRHLVVHRDAIVDQEYLDKSGDHTYSIGQRLVVTEASVLLLTDLVAKLGTALRGLV
ncbi:MAG: hypothetical protein H3C34_23270 [Caldilineaceae bacterium]|nr:hypothetical protein [Caldilineaceae bacterium]